MTSEFSFKSIDGLETLTFCDIGGCRKSATQIISWQNDSMPVCDEHIEEAKKALVKTNWGGKRGGAGRKPQGETYEQGYQAGYQAGMRKLGGLVRGPKENEEGIARQLEARGIATVSEVMAAFERRDSQRIGIWLLENAQHYSSKKQAEDGAAEQDDY